MRRRRFFQWIAGDDAGKVEILSSISEYDGEYYYNFESGESCNVAYISPMTKSKESLRGKAMVEVQDLNTLWTFSEVKSKSYRDETTGETYEIPPIEDIMKASPGQSINDIQSSVGIKHLVPPVGQNRSFGLPDIEEWLVKPAKPEPKVEAPNMEEKEEQVSNEPVSVSGVLDGIVEIAPNVGGVLPESFFCRKDEETNPIHIIIDRCKKVPVSVSLDVSLMLPSMSVYNMVNDNFDNGAECFIDYVISNLDIGMIIESLRESLSETYSAQGGE